jgi:hypothetical protein
MIDRVEYAADLLRQYKLVAGDEMYVEPHYDGTRVSYFYPVGGGATPKGSEITIPPAAGEIVMKLDQEYVFEENFDPTRISRLVFPDFVNNNRQAYGLYIYGYYWALLDVAGPSGLYQVIYNTPVPGILLLANSPFNGYEVLPPIGPHPRVNGVNYWFGGGVSLISL